MKFSIVLLLFLSSCAVGQASGPFCGGSQATAWGAGLLQKPALVIHCQNGEGLTLNSENQTEGLLQLLLKLAPLVAAAGAVP